MIPHFKVTPEAQKVVSKFEQAERKYNAAVDKILKKIAKQVKDEVKNGILSQIFPMKALTHEWFARKARDEKDPRILIESKDYVKSIRDVKIKDGEYGVEADPQKMLWNEYGTKKDPPRPHWRPALEKIFKEKDITAKELFHAILGD